MTWSTAHSPLKQLWTKWNQSFLRWLTALQPIHLISLNSTNMLSKSKMVGLHTHAYQKECAVEQVQCERSMKASALAQKLNAQRVDVAGVSLSQLLANRPLLLLVLIQTVFRMLFPEVLSRYQISRYCLWSKPTSNTCRFWSYITYL